MSFSDAADLGRCRRGVEPLRLINMPQKDQSRNRVNQRYAVSIANIKEIGETHLRGNYELEVIDAYQQAELVRDQQIVVLPTLSSRCLSRCGGWSATFRTKTRSCSASASCPRNRATPKHQIDGRDNDPRSHDRRPPARNADLRGRLEASEEMLAAIRSGEVDAITVETPAGLRVFTLKSADQPYRVMVETMSEGAVTVTPDDVILYSNQRFADMLRAGLDTIIGSSLLAHFADDDAARIAAAFAKQRDGNPAPAGNAVASDGTRVPVNVAMRSHDNGGAHVAAVITDLTELAASRGVLAATNLALERQLAESRQQAALLDQAHDAIFVTDMDDRIRYWNRGAETTYGIPAASAVGQDRRSVLIAEFPEPLTQIKAKLLRSGALARRARSYRRRRAQGGGGQPMVAATRLGRPAGGGACKSTATSPPRRRRRRNCAPLRTTRAA